MISQGLYTALITPFNAQGEVDLSGLEKLLSLQEKGGVDGLVLLGTTGEAPTLTEEEKRQILALGQKSSLPMIVGTSSYSTRAVIYNAEMAALYGAKAQLVTPPFYNKPTQEGIYRHFKTIAEESPLPILLYNIASRVGVNIELETFSRLLTLPQVIGIKESSGNIIQISQMLSLVRGKDLLVFAGEDEMTLPVMALGGHGVISVASNLYPKKMSRLVALIRQGKLEEARALHHTLTPLFRELFIETNPAPIKEAMNHFHLPAGEPRCPLTPLSLSKRSTLYMALYEKD